MSTRMGFMQTYIVPVNHHRTITAPALHHHHTITIPSMQDVVIDEMAVANWYNNGEYQEAATGQGLDGDARGPVHVPPE